MLSHRNIVSNIEGIEQAIHVDRKDCLMGILPFFHSFGFTAGLWLPMVSGFGVVFHADPTESRKVGELCRKYGVTLVIATPTFMGAYARRCEPDDFKSLRLAVVGAEKMRPDLAASFEAKFGMPLYEGYGCTELSPVVAVGTPGYSARDHQQVGHKPGSVGHPIPGITVRVVNPETLQDLEPGQDGMLLVRGPNVMLGYLDEPAKTRQVITKDGWYITGDIARLDEDGFISIAGRLSRFSKIGGEMVPHEAVEEVLNKALGGPEQRLVVTSAPDEQKGEKLVVLHIELSISVDELLRRVQESALPNLWLPKKENFFQIAALPLLGVGKLDLKQMKEMADCLSAGSSYGAQCNRHADST